MRWARMRRCAFRLVCFDFIPAEHGVTAESISALLRQRRVEVICPNAASSKSTTKKREDLSRLPAAVITDWLAAEPAGVYELVSYQGQILSVRDYLTGDPYEVYEGGGRGAVELAS
jgi:hypothetical protein